ncbi:hypothetical protein ACHQM5_022082 [Ranunculus cassubicifolius]
MSRTSGSCVEEKDEILRKGVQNMSLSFNNQGDSSQGSSLADEVTLPLYTRCRNCYKEHGSDSQCPGYECPTCFKIHHPSHCPYFRHLPKGASFGPGCDVVCACGNIFNEEGWFCTSCGGDWAILRFKHCFICNERQDHRSDECSKDKALAATYKIARDELRSRIPKRIPLSKVFKSPKTAYVPSSPVYDPNSPAFAPTSPWRSVSDDPTVLI